MILIKSLSQAFEDILNNENDLDKKEFVHKIDEIYSHIEKITPKITSKLDLESNKALRKKTIDVAIEIFNDCDDKEQLDIIHKIHHLILSSPESLIQELN